MFFEWFVTRRLPRENYHFNLLELLWRGNHLTLGLSCCCRTADNVETVRKMLLAKLWRSTKRQALALGMTHISLDKTFSEWQLVTSCLQSNDCATADRKEFGTAQRIFYTNARYICWGLDNDLGKIRFKFRRISKQWES